MHNKNEPGPELEGGGVLEKFNFLIEKYHQNGNAVVAEEEISDVDSIPVLTERITLRSKGAFPQFDALSPLRLLLDAALCDAKIDLDPTDRQALVQALENRIIVQEKNLQNL